MRVERTSTPTLTSTFSEYWMISGMNPQVLKSCHLTWSLYCTFAANVANTVEVTVFRQSFMPCSTSQYKITNRPTWQHRCRLLARGHNPWNWYLPITLPSWPESHLEADSMGWAYMHHCSAFEGAVNRLLLETRCRLVGRERLIAQKTQWHHDRLTVSTDRGSSAGPSKVTKGPSVEDDLVKIRVWCWVRTNLICFFACEN